jgi:hypothetical protein
MGSFVDPRRAEEQDLARAMAERIRAGTSHAEALRELRAAFPDSPLTLRVAALAMLARRTAGEPKRRHIPR